MMKENITIQMQCYFRSIKMRPGGCDGTKRTDSMEERISDLNAQFTFMVYESISTSLFQVLLFLSIVMHFCSFRIILLCWVDCIFHEMFNFFF